MNNADTPTTQALSTPPGPASGAPGTHARGGAQAGPGVLPLVERRETIPPLPAVASQPHTITSHHPDTGEVFTIEEVRPGFYAWAYTETSHQETRRQRYEIKDAVEIALGPDCRQRKCQRCRIDKTKDVEIKVSTESGRAFFSGFQACGSVWACPVCAPKITERRKVEVKLGIDNAISQGLKVMLLTATVPHGMGDDVRVILAGMKKAWSHTSQGRKAHDMRNYTGLVGTIRVLEVTYGKNGFHPHYHALLVMDTELTPEEIQKEWFNLWRDGCLKAGLQEPSKEHGLTVQDGTKAASYITKWGMEYELTKGHLKKGKTSLSPYDLSRVMAWGPKHHAISEELLETCLSLGIDQDRARALWVTFARAFKGQRQLIWSTGLRALLGLNAEKTDQELAEADEDTTARTVATVDNAARLGIIRRRAWSDVLIVAESDPGALPDFLETLQKRVKNSNQSFFYLEYLFKVKKLTAKMMTNLT